MLVGTMPCSAADGSAGSGGGSAVSFIDRTAYNSAVTPTDVTCGWELTSAGVDQGDGLVNRTWLLSGVGSDYELFASVTSGTLTTGTVGSWIGLGSNRLYEVTRTLNIAAVSEAVLACQVRRASDHVVIATFNITIQAEVLP